MGLKAFIVKLDNSIFRGRIIRLYRNIRYGGIVQDSNYLFFEYREHHIDNVNITVNRSKVVTIPTKDLILMQFDLERPDEFERYDLAARYMVLMEKDGLIDNGIEMDNLLQERWTGKVWEERYINLLENIRKEGFDDSHLIEVNRDLRLIDGSHRLTIALYTKREFVKVCINDCEWRSSNRIDWLWGLGLNQKQRSVLQETAKKMLDESRYPFACILWTPAREYFDSIIEELNQYSDNLSVIKYQDYIFDKNELEKFIEATYFLDDVTNENLRMKMQYNLHSSNVADGQYPIRVCWLDIKNPYYKVKSASGLPQSSEIVRCKEAFRRRYKDKVLDYKRDVIIHIADNYQQSKFIFSLLNIDRNLSELFRILNNDVNYAVIKEGHQATTFPIAFAFHTDVDILVDESELKKACEIVDSFIKKHFTGEWLEYFDESDDENRKKRVKMKGFSVFLFHIQIGVADLNKDFFVSAMRRRVLNSKGYYVLPDDVEVLIRLGEYAKYPKKIHHAEYVRTHYDLLSEQAIKNSFQFNRVKRVIQVWKEIFL